MLENTLVSSLKLQLLTNFTLGYQITNNVIASHDSLMMCLFACCIVRKRQHVLLYAAVAETCSIIWLLNDDQKLENDKKT